jgi:mannose-6-phosphate isomerase-like protein (cupin superfamily)
MDGPFAVGRFAAAIAHAACRVPGAVQHDRYGLRIVLLPGHASNGELRAVLATISASERTSSMIVVDVRDMLPEQWRLGVETRMLVSASNGAAQLCTFEQWIAPGAGAPTHTHPVEEVLTVREGEAEMWMDERRVIVSAGQSLIVPAARKHGFRNSGNVTLHLHAVLASPIFEATPEGATESVLRWEAV